MDGTRIHIAASWLAVLICTTATADPVTVGAANFCEVMQGSVTGNICALRQNGVATCAFKFSDSAPCTFVIVARGAPVGGSWPELRVRFDENEIYKTKVSSMEWATYTFASAVATGRHVLSVCLENDHYTNGQDWNLYFSDLTIIPAERVDGPVPLSAAEYRQLLSDQRDTMAREANERIEKIRKGNLTVKVVDFTGPPGFERPRIRRADPPRVPVRHGALHGHVRIQGDQLGSRRVPGPCKEIFQSGRNRERAEVAGHGAETRRRSLRDRRCHGRLVSDEQDRPARPLPVLELSRAGMGQGSFRRRSAFRHHAPREERRRALPRPHRRVRRKQ